MKKCTCTEGDVKQYLSRISGPLLDRIDICAEASRISYADIRSGRKSESSAAIRDRVERAALIQKERYRGTKLRFNADLSASDLI